MGTLGRARCFPVYTMFGMHSVACHGYYDPGQPMDWHLVLPGGDRLTLAGPCWTAACCAGYGR